MSQQTATILLKGGLNLITPAISIPPGQVSAAINYEPDVLGYSRITGLERYDGHPRPSDATILADISAAPALIIAVPGAGPVRGVCVYAGHIYAFRDSITGEGKMYRDSAAGWVEMTFGYELAFTTGTAEFLEGEVLTGGTSGATATIERVILTAGAWSGTASGFLVLSDIVGTFTAETITSTAGSATATTIEQLTLPAGGIYDFTVHNFYGAAKTPRMYFVNGEGFAYEWDGEVLAMIRTGTNAGPLEDTVSLTERDGDIIISRSGDTIILRYEFDRPLWITNYKNHLFLGYRSGSLIFSSIGLPLQYLALTGAGEISVGEELTGLLSSASTAFVVFCRNRIDYITGNDSSDFVMSSISDSSGAVPRTAQMMNGPVYLDDGGIRNLGTTAAFGDWQSGTMSQMVEPLMKAKRDASVGVSASMRVKGKDQYRLFWDDGTGVTLFTGRKDPEILPFNIPIDVFCSCSGEVADGRGDRLFVGADDGYVYELDRGTSFDGATISAYIRLPFNSVGSAYQDKRWHKATFEISTPDTITVGMAFDIDYARGIGGTQVVTSVNAGAAIVTTELFDDIDWTDVVQGTLESHIDGIGRNLAATIITEASDKRAHTLSAATLNFSYRALKR